MLNRNIRFLFISLLILCLPSGLFAYVNDLGVVNHSVTRTGVNMPRGWIVHHYKFKATTAGKYRVSIYSQKKYVKMKAGKSEWKQDFFRDASGNENMRQGTAEVTANQWVYLTVWKNDKQESSKPLKYNLKITFVPAHTEQNGNNQNTNDSSTHNSNTDNQSLQPNAMILTRDGTSRENTRIYTFHIDTQKDKVTNFKYVKTIQGTYNSLVYYDGKFLTAKAWGEGLGQIYSIGLDGKMVHETKYGDIKGSLYLGAIQSLAFDENGNKLFTQGWNADGHISKNSAGNYIYTNQNPNVNYALAYRGDHQLTLSFEDVGVKNLDLSNENHPVLTQIHGIDGGVSCIYGGEAVSEDKSYFVMSHGNQNDKQLFVVNGNEWKSTGFNYGQYTGNSKAEALAIVHKLGKAACEPGLNLVKNPSFEDSNYKNHWIGDIWAGHSYHIPQGSTYAYVDSNHGGVGYQDIPIQKDNKYILSFYAAYGDTYGGQTVSIEYLDADHNPINIQSAIQIKNSIHPSSDFKQYRLSLPKAPKNATYIRIKFDVKQGDFLKVDNFDLRVNCGEDLSKPASLIADYHFDACDYDGIDGEVKDYSGNNHNGTVLFGDTTSDSGQVKRSIKFQKGRIYVGGISEFDKNNFSISFWTKINGSSSTNKQTLLDKTNEIKITYFENDKTLHIRAYKKGKPAIFKTDELNIGDNNWHHIVLIKDGDVPTLYIDDQNKSFSTWYWSSSTSQGKSGDLTIGGENKKDNTTSSADQSHANIDEVKLYNGVLTKDEIEDIYQNEKEGKNYDGSARETQECAIPFECKSNSYLIKSETSDALSSSVMRFNLIRGTVDESVDNVGTYNINAVGFNPKDGFMYGWSAEKEGWGSYHRPNAHIVKIDSHYHTYEVPLKNEIPDSKMRFFLGDISKDGIFYFANMGAEKAADGNYKKYYLETIRVVDLTDRRALDTIKIKYPSGVRHIQNADFAINPIDDQLYTVNSKNNQLVRIIISSSDPSKIGMVEELGEIYPIKKYPNETISGRYDPKLSGLYVWEDEGDILTWDNKTIRAYRKFPGDSFYTRFNQFDTYSVYSYFDKFGYYYLQIKDKVYKVNISHPWQGHDKNKARAIEFSALKFDTSGDGARCALAPVGDHPLVMIKNAQVKEGTGETKMMKFHLDSDRNISRADLSCSIHLINGEANRDDFAPWLDHYAFKLSNINVDKGYELEIPIAGDHQPEREESFILHCDSPDLIFVKASDHNATGTIIDDDINKIDAWDIDTIKRLKTKIVNHHTTIRIHQVDAQGEPTNTTNSEDMNRTRYRIVDMDDAGHLCGMEAKDLSYDDFNQSFVFDNSGKADITLIVDHAIKRAKLQFLWLDRNGTKQTSCSSDMFAVRPDHFVLNLPSTLKAGHDFNITIEAQDENNHRVLGYQEREGDSFQIDVNDTNPTKCALDSSFTLSGVEIPQTVTKKYNEAGNVRIKIYEKRNGKEFANVDENDTGISDEQLLIHKAEKTIAVRPDHFKVTTQLTNIYGTSEVNKYAVISNHVSSSPTLTISVEAQTESNQSIKNYYDECAAEDVIVVPGLYVHSDDNGNNPSKLLVAEDINDSISTPNVNDVTESPYQCPDHLPVDSAREGINQMEHMFGDIAESYTLNKTMFKKENNGKGSKILRLNFFRNKSIPMNPINVQFNSVYVQDGKNSDVFGLATLNKSVTYLYMRTFIEPALEVVGKRDLDAKVYYEAYEPGALGRRSVSGEDGWRIIDYNPHIPTMKFGIDSIKYSGRINVTKTDSSTLHIHANNLPESNEVQLSRDDDFKYVTDTIKTHVTFTPDSANWAGKGNAGRTIDNNISTIRQFKRISW